MSGGFWRGRRVLLTGHTGFKGAWLSLWLERLGAQVTGVALPPEGDTSLFDALAPWPRLDSRMADIRDVAAMRAVVAETQPQIILHLAAQAFVLRSYDQPVETFAANVMGTVHVLEAARQAKALEAVVVVTTDKVYRNDHAGVAFREDEPLGSSDPYSSSKAAAELAAASYGTSFLPQVALATARAGNVIGGGDWGEKRLIPDVIRSWLAGGTLDLRYPGAIRPWQHVFEGLAGYLALAEALATRRETMPPALNFGPSPRDFRPVAEVVDAMLGHLGATVPIRQVAPQAAEAPVLTLDSSLARGTLQWRSRLDLDETLRLTAEWYRAWRRGADMRALSLEQLARYETLPPIEE